MTAPTLVTGPCGFIGSYLVSHLLEDGVPVRTLIHHANRLTPDVRARVEIVAGDLRDDAALRAAVDGADTVLHLAATASAFKRDPQEFWDVNVHATGRLLHYAAVTGVRRVVHVSTILAAPPWRPAHVGAAAARLTPYEATKMAAERLVQEACDHGLHVVTVRPTRVYGPGPTTEANAVTRLIAQYLAGAFRVRLADRGALANYVHAADVAGGIRLAAARGRPGSCYVLGGPGNVSLADLLALVAELGGRRRITVPLPAGLGVAVGRAAELWGRLGGTPPVTAGWVRTFLEDRRAEIGPAVRDLGYRPRALRDGLAETITWLRDTRMRGAA